MINFGFHESAKSGLNDFHITVKAYVVYSDLYISLLQLTRPHITSLATYYVLSPFDNHVCNFFGNYITDAMLKLLVRPRLSAF